MTPCHIVGIAFFGLLVVAAITSSVALLEIPVACAIERWGLPRARATLLIGGTAFLLGVPSSLGFGLLSAIRFAGMPTLDAVDFVASNILLPLSGLAIALFAGWHWRETDAAEAAGIQRQWLARLWRISIRYVAPAMSSSSFYDRCRSPERVRPRYDVRSGGCACRLPT